MMSSQLVQPNSARSDDEGANQEEGEDESLATRYGYQNPSKLRTPTVPSSIRRPAAPPRMRRPPVPSRSPGRLVGQQQDPSPVKVRKRRRQSRPVTPDIVLERRSHRHHHSPGDHRILRIPLDNRPTLGLRGPPRRFIEIERIPCRRRRRRCRSPCYDLDSSMALPDTSPIVMGNPITTPSSPSTPTTSNWFSHLTPEMIENLPRQTVHLPPIYLPGSRATAETGLHTVIFPAEIINPIDGSLSIIQVDRSEGSSPAYTKLAPSYGQSLNRGEGVSFTELLSQLIQQSMQPLTFLAEATGASLPFAAMQNQYKPPSIGDSSGLRLTFPHFSTSIGHPSGAINIPAKTSSVTLRPSAQPMLRHV